MLNIEKKQEDKQITFVLKGRLDTTTAPELDGQIKEALTGIEMCILDLTDLEYISSAGLRVLLSAQKIMSKQGKMVVRNVTEEVKEILEVTGFTDILTIEE